MSDEFLLGADQRPQPLGEQGDVEGLFEALVDVGPIDRDLRAVVWQQSDHDGIGILRVPPQILADLLRVDPADLVVHHDAVGVEALSLNARLEAAGGNLDLE